MMSPSSVVAPGIRERYIITPVVANLSASIRGAGEQSTNGQCMRATEVAHELSHSGHGLSAFWSSCPDQVRAVTQQSEGWRG